MLICGLNKDWDKLTSKRKSRKDKMKNIITYSDFYH